MSSTYPSLTDLWRPALVVLATGFLYAAVLARLVGHWWIDENYSHGLLVPFVVAYVVWLNFEDIKASIGQPAGWIGGGFILAALGSLLAGTLGAEVFSQRISLVIMLAGLLVYFFGTRIIKTLAVPFVLILLAIPIPQIIFNRIAFPLQIYASQIAVWGIRLFDVPTLRKGNVIEILPEGATQVIALEVVEACSGIRSLMTLMTLALVLAYFTRKSATTDQLGRINNPNFWRGALLMFSAIPIAIITNAGRVTATGVMTFYYGNKATEGILHDSAGLVVYLVALILLIAFNLLLIRILGSLNKAK